MFLFVLMVFNLQAQESMISENGKFKIVFPGEYTYQTEKIDTDAGLVDMHMYMYEDEYSAYLISYSDYPDTFDESLVSESLQGAKDGFIENLQLEETYSLEIRMNGYPGLYYKAEGGDYYAIMYVILRDNRLYQVGVLQQYSYADPEFLESFKLLK